MRFSSSALASLALLAATSPTTISAKRSRSERIDVGLEVGARDRFWKHHVTGETLIYNGVDYYQDIKSCIQNTLSEEEMAQVSSVQSTSRQAGEVLRDPVFGNAMLVIVEHAMHPVHVKAVQTLASCVRTFLPHLYESRAMYQEMDLDEDDGLGGNCPTHLAPLVGVFFPEVIAEMDQTLQTAYKAAGWQEIVDREKPKGHMLRQKKLFPPEEVGMRASEHLTYSDFPSLAEHTDGDTCYTMNFSFGKPEDYQGGEFFIIAKDKKDKEVQRYHFKPNQYAALVFLGGRYLHGVDEIRGGHREMFSTEFWPYPDAPFGSNLWSNYPTNMEEYIEACNNEILEGNTGPCKTEYDRSTPFHDSIDEVREKYGEKESSTSSSSSSTPDSSDTKGDHQALFDDDMVRPPPPHVDRQKDDRQRPNRVRPSSLKPVQVIWSDKDGNRYTSDDFYPEELEPYFMVPKNLEPGQMMPLRWREDLNPVDGPDGETFIVGFPKELNQEFKKYIEKNGMMRIAHEMLYKEEPLEAGEQRIYTLDDGEKWTAMVQGEWNNDMVWLDPGDESAFESLLGVLRRGGFDKVLEQVGKTFDLDGLMIQGVGAIFLSENRKTDNMHVDIVGSRGSFYNIIVPVHIPEGEEALFKLADKADEDFGDEYNGHLRLDPNVGVVLGGESRHGTGECNYKKNEDFRLSFAVYVADINDDNVDLIASDSTSLWPTEGDTFWFEAQKGRLWTRDGKHSLKFDKGRKPLNIQDKSPKCATMDKSICMTDLQNMRLKCPKTCELYLEDDVYYAKYFPENVAAVPSACESDSNHPTCPNNEAETATT